jgi:hypothetical protein
MLQAFYFKAPNSRNWPAGQVRTYYFKSVYADTAGAALRMMCMSRPAELLLNPGVVCAGFERQPTSGGWNIGVRLRNSSGRELTPAMLTEVRLGLQVGA